MRKDCKKPGVYHHGNLKEAVLKHAVKVIRSEGEAAVCVREIAKDVGVSHSAVYRHFEDRCDILASVAEEGFRILCQRLDDALTATQPPLSGFRRMGEAYVLFALEHPAHFKVMFLTELCDSKTYPDLDKVSWEAFDRVVKVVNDEIASGRFRSEDTTLVATSAWASVHGLAHLMTQKQLHSALQAKKDPLQIIRKVTELMEVGLLRKK